VILMTCWAMKIVNLGKHGKEMRKLRNIFSHFTARPPTPPKELSDEEDKPQSIDIGPPLHPHGNKKCNHSKIIF
jgi:hypothetical protein